jgi:HAD superfamily hydrolase (TIGR01450 family)
MKDYKGYILDLDGVIYKGSQKIESAIEFINEEKKKGKEFFFITNNSTKSKQVIKKKLIDFGIERIDDTNILTSGMVTGEYLKKHLQISCKNRVLCLTADIVKEQLKAIGCQILNLKQYKKADFVVVGETDFVREDLYYAVNAIKHHGAFLIGTNGDIVDPTETGESKPVAGAILAYIEACTGIEAKVMGKPYPDIYEMILQKTNIKRYELLMIGDRLDTDIVGANELGIDTVLVETGIHRKEDCELLGIHPSYIVSNLKELLEN